MEGILRIAHYNAFDDSSATTLQITGLSVNEGDVIALGICLNFAPDGSPSAQWTPDAGTPLAFSITGSAFPGGAGSGGLYTFGLTIVSGSTGTGVIDITFGTTINSSLATAVVIRNLPNATFDNIANTGGDSGTADSGDAVTTYADEYLQGWVYTNENGAGNGAWQNSFTSGSVFGNGNASNKIRLADGYRIVSATGTYKAEKTLGSSQPWAAIIQTFG